MSRTFIACARGLERLLGARDISRVYIAFENAAKCWLLADVTRDAKRLKLGTRMMSLTLLARACVLERLLGARENVRVHIAFVHVQIVN